MRHLHGEGIDLARVTTLADHDLMAKALELTYRHQHAEVPRQVRELDRLVGHYAFEITARAWETKDLESLYEAESYDGAR